MFRFSSEQQSKAKMAAEIEELKRDYEDKLKEVTVSHTAIKCHFWKLNHNFKILLWKYEKKKASKVNERAKTATESRKVSSNSTEGVGDAVPVASPIMVNGVANNQNGNMTEAPVNQEQLKAMEK